MGILEYSSGINNLASCRLVTCYHFFLSPVIIKNIMKVETDKEDEALDCSMISRPAEKNSLEGLVTCLQDTNKRKRTLLSSDGSGSHQDILSSVKRRGLTQEVISLLLRILMYCFALRESSHGKLFSKRSGRNRFRVVILKINISSEATRKETNLVA